MSQIYKKNYYLDFIDVLIYLLSFILFTVCQQLCACRISLYLYTTVQSFIIALKLCFETQLTLQQSTHVFSYQQRYTNSELTSPTYSIQMRIIRRAVTTSNVHRNRSVFICLIARASCILHIICVYAMRIQLYSSM